MTDPRRTKTDLPPRKARVIPKTLKYDEVHEYLLRRIASAIVLQWDELSDALQDLIVDQAVAVQDREEAAHEAADIENFIRHVKIVALKAAAPSALK